MHTVGGVISAAEPAMLIVPTDETLSLDARVMPNDIDQIALDQHTIVRVHASNQRTTPELNGTVTRIGADVSRDQQTGMTFYTIRVSLPKEEIQRLGKVHLVAGMRGWCSCRRTTARRCSI